MRTIIVLFFAVCIIPQINAQEKIVKGQIIIDLDDSSPAGIRVKNLRTGFTYITDLTGGFSVRAQTGDVLLIESAFYETRKFQLTEDILNKEILTIHLNLQPIILGEAVITRKMTGYLDEDSKYDPRDDKLAKLYRDLGINPDGGGVRDTANFSFGKDIGITHFNVERAFDAITGDLKKRRRLFEYEGREQKIESIREYFGDKYFTIDLQIPREKIREFIFFSYETGLVPIYYSNKNYFAIMMEFAKLAPEYRKRLSAHQTEE